jgi:TonB family protein
MADNISDTPFHEGTGGVPLERRVHARRPLSALAYLDIGSDNGGIVLNISEGGVKMYAVNSLENHSDLKLRIQLPGCDAQIETEARIAWLGKGDRQAGVCFVGFPADGRAQIQEWLRSEGAPSACQSAGVEKKEDPPPASATEPIEEQGAGASSALVKWRKLLAELEASAAACFQPEPARTPVRNSEELRGQVRVPVPKPELVSGQFGETGNRATVASQRDEVSSPSPAHQQFDDSATVEKAHPIHPNYQEIANSDLSITPSARPILLRSASQTATATASGGMISSQLPAEPRSTVARVKNELSTFLANVRLATGNASQKRKLKWYRNAVLFLAVAVISFGVGTRIGRTAHRAHQEGSAAVPPTKALEVFRVVEDRSREPAARHMSRRRKEVLLAPAIAHKDFAPPANPPNIVAVEQHFQVLPEEIQSAPVVTKPSNSSPVSPVPTTRYFAAETSRRLTVDGPVLKPTDRFNPCHLTYRVEPVYPPEAERQGIQGAVRIRQVIGADGSIQSVKLLGGPELLAPAALDAARYWRYLPALLNGAPVTTEQDIEIDFRLPQQSKQ